MTQIALGLSAIVLALLYAIGISQIPLLGFGDPLGPKLLPMFLAGALGIVGLALLVEGRSVAGLSGGFDRFRGFIKSRDFAIVAAVAIWTALYFSAFSYLGYLLSTALFLSVLMALAHRGRRSVAISVALSFSIGSYLLFAQVFGVPLPRGLLPF